MNTKKLFWAISLLLLALLGNAQVATVKVHVNTKHRVGDIEEFDREKFITIHADIERDWSADHLLPDVRKDFLEGHDVYLGRETGGLTGTLNRVRQDPNRPGFADVAHLESMGQKARRAYAKKTNLHRYEKRLNKMVIGSQFHPFWPDGKKTKQGWALSQKNAADEPLGTATGEFMAHYLNAFFGGEGKPRPQLVEVINEPLWDLIPKKKRGKAEEEMEAVRNLALFHKTVATEIKKLNPNVQVGGYTCAFPDFERYDFKRWEYRWKHFIDLVGEDMDFWSIHLYDFPCKEKWVNGKKTYVKKFRKGSNIEATLDMLEQYSTMKFGKVTPLVISEYSTSAHQYRFLPWTPWRDYLYVKSANSMLMTFMDHPQAIATAIPFIMLRCEWGRTPEGNPYRSRLFRQQFEKEGETGNKWVYTDMVKFYKLWADVKGKRIDISTDNVDVQTQAFVDGKKAYVILNNLTETKMPINLQLFGQQNNKLKSLKIKQYYSPYKPEEIKREGIIDEKTFRKQQPQLELESEATMVLEYTFKKRIKLNESKEETKYYAAEYYKNIEAEQVLTFNLNGVKRAKNGQAMLRIGIGRDHGKVLKPQVYLNGTALDVPNNYAGVPQTERERFYGIIHVPVAYKLLQQNNQVELKFPDAGGHVASVTLRVFNLSRTE